MMKAKEAKAMMDKYLNDKGIIRGTIKVSKIFNVIDKFAKFATAEPENKIDAATKVGMLKVINEIQTTLMLNSCGK